MRNAIDKYATIRTIRWPETYCCEGSERRAWLA